MAKSVSSSLLEFCRKAVERKLSKVVKSLAQRGYGLEMHNFILLHTSIHTRTHITHTIAHGTSKLVQDQHGPQLQTRNSVVMQLMKAFHSQMPCNE